MGEGELGYYAQFYIGRQPPGERQQILCTSAPPPVFVKHRRLIFSHSITILIIINDTSSQPIMYQTSCHLFGLHLLWPSHQLWKPNSNYNSAQGGNFLPPISPSCGRWGTPVTLLATLDTPAVSPESRGRCAFAMYSEPCRGSCFDLEQETPDQRGCGVLFRQLAWA